MAQPLLLDLNDQDKVLLAQLTIHPGWRVVERMMAEYCTNSTAAVVKLDPLKEPQNYAANLQTLHMQARVANDICSSLLRSIKVLVTEAVSQQQEEEGQTTEDLIQQVVNRVRPTAQ